MVAGSAQSLPTGAAGEHCARGRGGELEPGHRRRAGNIAGNGEQLAARFCGEADTRSGKRRAAQWSKTDGSRGSGAHHRAADHPDPANECHLLERLDIGEGNGGQQFDGASGVVSHQLKPQLVRKFKVSTAPILVQKVQDIVGLCLNSPEHALVLRCSVQHPFTSHFQTQSCTSRDAVWLRSMALQAITRHSDVPCLESGSYAAGPATEMSLYEAAAMAAPCVVSGGSVESGPTARATHTDYLAPITNLFAAEVGRSVAGMSRKDVNSLVLKLLDKYESRLADPPMGQRFQDCYDMPSRQPKAEALEAYRRVRAEVLKMGLEFKDPPFYG